ncbi:NF-kappa-B inhibitor cactus [Ostrinia furnacalis]|uniref:NF-kappa-B inhibitor cactus n=1 Tax=Ostrinia furnacalis TaxID=93504 RepID=UPI0010396F67|nr:NF-kappa-B inhibitor cactus [Ostrinia furnacalis]
MSADKGFDTKIPVEINTDSGFLSGPIDRLDSEDLGPPSETVKSEYVEENIDSGLDLCSGFASIGISDVATHTSEPSRSSQQSTCSSEDLPVRLLFRQDDDGDTQLHIAAVHGCEKTIGILIKLCPEKALLDIQNDYRHTALHLAVMGGFSVVTRMLVLAGSSLAVRDICGRTPVHIAAETSNVDCLKALLAPIIEQPHRKLGPILNQKDYNGQTCVHAAAAAGHVKTLQTLVHYGAEINAREGLAGWTALHIAARRGDVRLSQYLLEQCAGVVKNPRDNGGRTPRRLAKRTAAERLFANVHADSDSESEDDDDYDSEGENLFERLRDNLNPINVA